VQLVVVLVQAHARHVTEQLQAIALLVHQATLLMGFHVFNVAVYVLNVMPQSALNVIQGPIFIGMEPARALVHLL